MTRSQTSPRSQRKAITATRRRRRSSSDTPVAPRHRGAPSGFPHDRRVELTAALKESTGRRAPVVQRQRKRLGECVLRGIPEDKQPRWIADQTRIVDGSRALWIGLDGESAPAEISENLDHLVERDAASATDIVDLAALAGLGDQAQRGH